MKTAMKYPLEIQFFAEQESPEGKPAANESGSTAPSIDIDYDKLADTLSKRSQAASDSALKGYLQSQGLSGSELEAAITDFKAKQKEAAEQKANLTNTLQTENTDLKNQLFAERLNSAVMIQAGGLNIAANKIPYLQKLIDTTNVTDEKGGIDNAKVKSAIEAVLKDFPELKGTTETNTGFHQIGGNSGNGNQGSIEDELDRAFGIKKK